MTGNEILLSLSHKKGNKEVFFRNITNLKLAKEIIFSNLVESSYETFEDLCIHKMHRVYLCILKTYLFMYFEDLCTHKMHRVYLQTILMQWKGGRYVAVLIIIMYRNATI